MSGEVQNARGRLLNVYEDSSYFEIILLQEKYFVYLQRNYSSRSVGSTEASRKRLDRLIAFPGPQTPRSFISAVMGGMLV